MCYFFLVNTRGKKYIVLVTYFMILRCSCIGQFDCNQSLFFIYIFKGESLFICFKAIT